MNAYITTEYKIDYNELKTIVQHHFWEKTGKQIPLRNITFEIYQQNYCEPELKSAVITEETVQNNVFGTPTD